MKLLVSLLFVLASANFAQEGAQFFNRVASFPVNTNLPQDMEQTTETSAEIIAVSEDGMTLVYSDSPLGAVGMIDITDPAAPKAAGVVTLEGEPTSVTVVGTNILVAVNTSESFTEPSGTLAVIDMASRTVTASCDLGGQPDSVAVSSDETFLAVAIENERDEDVNDGAIPQLPAGNIAIYTLENSTPDCDSLRTVELTNLAEVAAEDPEPEFVDINEDGEIVVTLQENSHIVIINAADASVVSHFSAGTVDLSGIDTEEDGALTFDGELRAVPREPDAVQWLDTERLVVANEGDYEGGTRGFTIFSNTGEVLFESGADLEYQIAMAGHYPEARSDAKGVEPEGMEIKQFGDETFIFVLSERGSVIGVYRDTGAEGITKIGDTLWIAIQRQWGDDPENTVKLVSYNLETEEWGAVRYPTEPAGEGWVGLSEITAYGDYVYIVERDDQIGDAAKLKKLYRVAISALQPSALGGELPLVTKEEVHDFMPDLKATGGYVVDKLEGFAIDVNGNGFAVTDNDGVDDSNGETLFFAVDITTDM